MVVLMLSVAIYVEDNATTLKMMGLTKTADKIFQWYEYFDVVMSNGKGLLWYTCLTHERDDRLMHLVKFSQFPRVFQSYHLGKTS